MQQKRAEQQPAACLERAISFFPLHGLIEAAVAPYRLLPATRSDPSSQSNTAEGTQKTAAHVRHCSCPLPRRAGRRAQAVPHNMSARW